MRRKLVAGNWKMNGSHSANAELLAALVGGRPYGADVAVCVPFVYINEAAATLAGSDIRWGAQDVSAHEQGAYTGEVSAAMLAECGCRYTIVGHSERRAYHGENDALVAQKAQAAVARDRKLALPLAPNRLPDAPLPNDAPMSAPLPCWISTRPIIASAASSCTARMRVIQSCMIDVSPRNGFSWLRDRWR